MQPLSIEGRPYLSPHVRACSGSLQALQLAPSDHSCSWLPRPLSGSRLARDCCIDSSNCGLLLVCSAVPLSP